MLIISITPTVYAVTCMLRANSAVTLLIELLIKEHAAAINDAMLRLY